MADKEGLNSHPSTIPPNLERLDSTDLGYPWSPKAQGSVRRLPQNTCGKASDAGSL